jgi:hypothetical protein
VYVDTFNSAKEMNNLPQYGCFMVREKKIQTSHLRRRRRNEKVMKNYKLAGGANESGALKKVVVAGWRGR